MRHEDRDQDGKGPTDCEFRPQLAFLGIRPAGRHNSPPIEHVSVFSRGLTGGCMDTTPHLQVRKVSRSEFYRVH
jgi:hypothetical protein